MPNHFTRRTVPTIIFNKIAEGAAQNLKEITRVEESEERAGERWPPAVHTCQVPTEVKC